MRRVLRSMPGDRDATFTALFDAHFDPLLAYARRRTGELSDAEDLVAETFIVAWRRFDRLPERAEEQLPWLYGVARRLLANRRRSAGRRLRLFERLRSSFAVSTPPRAPDIGAALAALPERDQEILRLVALEALTHAEVATVLGITPNAVAIRIHRARKRLGDALKGPPPTRTFPEWKGSVIQGEHGDEVT
jgi:RNA polymerase sigma-70 factor (ECF subfamily)